MLHQAAALHARLFHEYLETCDVAGVRRLWRHLAPHLPQPKNDFQTMVMIHRARAESVSVPFAKRAYSHQWLVANGLPSSLPNHLRPRAEHYDYRFAFGVGIGGKVTGNDPTKRALFLEVRAAMGQAVEELFADGCTDHRLLRRRMGEAKERALRQFGRPKVNVKVTFNFSGLPQNLKAVDPIAVTRGR